MGSSKWCSWVVLFWVFLIWAGTVFGKSDGSNGKPRDYISWSDLRISRRHHHRTDMDNNMISGTDHDGSRVIVVDKNGHGDARTVQGAVDMVPTGNTQRVKIFIRPGIYREKVYVPASKPYISILGNPKDAGSILITWNSKASDKDSNGGELGTYRSATVAVESDYFCASGITVENTVVAKPGSTGMQAVALRIAGNKAVFFKVRILGTQDTLLDEVGSHYFFKCHIEGSIDFIFGNAKSLYQSCILKSKARDIGAIAAHHRESASEDSGFSFVNSTISGSGSVYLGRAWGKYSRAVYSYCYMEDIINPIGWSDWNFPERQKTAEFGEFMCWGKGADERRRVPWMKSFNLEQVRPFLDKNFINNEEQWLRI